MSPGTRCTASLDDSRWSLLPSHRVFSSTWCIVASERCATADCLHEPLRPRVRVRSVSGPCPGRVRFVPVRSGPCPVGPCPVRVRSVSGPCPVRVRLVSIVRSVSGLRPFRVRSVFGLYLYAPDPCRFLFHLRSRRLACAVYMNLPSHMNCRDAVRLNSISTRRAVAAAYGGGRWRVALERVASGGVWRRSGAVHLCRTIWTRRAGGAGWDRVRAWIRWAPAAERNGTERGQTPERRASARAISPASVVLRKQFDNSPGGRGVGQTPAHGIIT